MNIYMHIYIRTYILYIYIFFFFFLSKLIRFHDKAGDKKYLVLVFFNLIITSLLLLLLLPLSLSLLLLSLCYY